MDKSRPQFSKIYIYGLDTFTTEMVETFAAEHYQTDDFKRIEWIDDLSANIVYTNADAANQALAAFARDPQEQAKPPNELRIAKRLSSHVLLELQVRQATVGDKKKPRAHEASRFYLMNPDLDPHENGTIDRLRQNRGKNERGDYRRRRFDDRENRRRQEGQAGIFNADMYDDNAGGDAGSYSDAGEYRRRGRGRGRRGSDDLFGGETGKGRLRNRSASPIGDGDGRMGFTDDQPRRQTARQRSSTPPHLRQRQRPKELFSASNAKKELFSSTTNNSSILAESDGGAVKDPKELFPNSSPLRSPKELFPHRSSVSHHRRTPAFDAKDETTIERFSPKPRSLADRITGGPAPRPGAMTSDGDAFEIRGASRQGFNFKGRATADQVHKELFPTKTGNEGKELFSEKIKGRGGPRRRAQDLFDS